MPLHWRCLHQSELDVATLYELLTLRTQVFVVEQRCAYLETDGQDLLGDTCHLLAYADSGQLMAYARLRDPLRQQGQVVIGRVVVAPQARGLGLAHTLLERALDHCQLRWPQAPIYLSAQAHLQSFYERHGFGVVTEQYLEDDIPHIGMRRP